MFKSSELSCETYQRGNHIHEWPKEKYKRTNNDLHTYKTKDRVKLSSDLKKSYVIPIRIEMIHKRHKSCDILTVTLFSLYNRSGLNI